MAGADGEAARWLLRRLRHPGYQAMLPCGKGFANGDTYKFSTFRSTAGDGKTKDWGLGPFTDVPDGP